MDRRPEDRRALGADGSQNDEHGPNFRGGLECAMREEPMIPSFDAEGAHGIETDEQGHVEFADADLERDEDCGDDPKRRTADYSKGDASFSLSEGVIRGDDSDRREPLRSFWNVRDRHSGRLLLPGCSCFVRRGLSH